jgi:tetratricopeptide (TPR) repeat protein
MNRNNLKARFLNDLNRGSWLLWQTKQPVFIDGRLEVMQEEFFREYQKSFQRNGLLELISKYRPSLVIFDYSYPEAMIWDIYLQQMPEWRKIYWDETTVIYALNDYRPDLKPIDFVATVSKMGIDTTINSDQIWRSLQKPTQSRFTSWLRGFYRHKYFPAELGKMAYYASVNLEFRASELLYYEFIRKTDQNHYAAYLGLGTIYMLSEQLDRALYCYERALQKNPKSDIAARRIRDIKAYREQLPSEKK